jgi:hypothetical protein
VDRIPGTFPRPVAFAVTDKSEVTIAKVQPHETTDNGLYISDSRARRLSKTLVVFEQKPAE